MKVFEWKISKALKALLLLLTTILPYPAIAQSTGEMHYSTADTRYEFFDGSHWYDFDLGIPLGVCTKEAEMEFDTLLSTYKYCNGAFWIPVAGIVTLSGCIQKGEIDFFSGAYHFCNGLLWVRMKGSLL